MLEYHKAQISFWSSHVVHPGGDAGSALSGVVAAATRWVTGVVGSSVCVCVYVRACVCARARVCYEWEVGGGMLSERVSGLASLSAFWSIGALWVSW